MAETTQDARTRPGLGYDLRRLRKLKRITLALCSRPKPAARSDSSARSSADCPRSRWPTCSASRACSRCRCRGSSINELAPPEERGRVVRANARRRVGSREDGLVEELLSPDLGGCFEVFRSVFEPAAEMAEPQQRATEETGYIVSGELEMWLEGTRFHLQAGDSFRFAGESYRWRNPGTVQTVVVWVIAPPVY